MKKEHSVHIKSFISIGIAAGLAFAACSKNDSKDGGEGPEGTTPSADAPKDTKPLGPFSLAWSEYPSWSVFDVASARGYIDGKEGKLGEFEKKHNVDIVLKQAEYDPCITMYGSGEVDAVAITNMDILKPSLSRKSVAILPTSTSYGADAVIVNAKKVKKLRGLKKVETRGLDLSVSEYMFARNLELNKENPKKFKYKSMDPGAAALAMQQGQKGMDSIAVWNPFVLQTLEKRGKDVKVLFDSTSIPGEIIDMVVMGQDSLSKKGGEAFAHALIEAFYRVNQDLEDEGKRDDTLTAIGEKFANLPIESMRKVVDMTRFYGTAEDGLKAFGEGELLAGVTDKKLTDIMPLVVKFSKEYGIVEKEPKIAYGPEGEADLRFDPTYMKNVAEAKPQAAAPAKGDAVKKEGEDG